jgi:hypothetical protein
VHTQAVRLFSPIETRQRVGLDDDAPTPLHHVDIDDSSGDRDRPEVPLQHWRVAFPRRFPHQREPGGKRSEHQCCFTPCRVSTQRKRPADPGNRRRNARP